LISSWILFQLKFGLIIMIDGPTTINSNIWLTYFGSELMEI
jgi:hypothetical protein